MTVELILSRLNHVRESQPNQWTALCPAHDDRSPSLSVRETDDSTVLLHCFAGCAAADVVAAVGLELSDLFPPKPESYEPKRRKRPRLDGWTVLQILEHRIAVLMLAATDLKNGKVLSGADFETLTQAFLDITHILEEARAIR